MANSLCSCHVAPQPSSHCSLQPFAPLIPVQAKAIMWFSGPQSPGSSPPKPSRSGDHRTGCAGEANRHFTRMHTHAHSQGMAPLRALPVGPPSLNCLSLPPAARHPTALEAPTCQRLQGPLPPVPAPHSCLPVSLHPPPILEPGHPGRRGCCWWGDSAGGRGSFPALGFIQTSLCSGFSL